MKLFQVAKYYKPLNSAQAFQAVKLTDALKNVGLDVVSFVGGRDGKKTEIVGNVVYIPYTETFVNQKVFSKMNRGIKELNQLYSANSWVVDTTNKLVELYKPVKTDVILTQSTPFDTHFVGDKIKKDYGSKWIAAFSDPFPISIAPEPYKGANHIPFISKIQKNKLRNVLERADHILVSSLYAYNLMCEFCSVKVQDKYSIIPHIGLDVNRLNHSENKNGWIVHTGNLTKERVVDEFFQAVKKVIIDNKEFKGVKFIGRVSNLLIQKTQDYQIQDFITLKGEVPQDEIYREVEACSGLLAIEAKMSTSPFLPSKFADYATLSKPIICLTPQKSEMRNYLNKFGGGIACDFNSEEIASAINDVVSGRCKNSKDLENYFTSQNVGRIYNNIISKVS
ncbi:MAG: hypothetical protein HRU50_09245 [Winogradskyella sp.]|uniref:hypothetical protein n=1 Tax=Winogradskyella sp. TaxID=1883156 RepID=UPI0025EDB56B|nr:hypothetical protein [Winogradskyella sp.]NRB60104.1 hypothetical protein [Winogradskyella sp.]